MHKPGFTSIELVFAVSYSFTLFFTAVNGLSTAQITYRDNARRAAVDSLVQEVDAYYIRNQRYPEQIKVAEKGSKLLLDDKYSVSLVNPAAALDRDLVSTSQATAYCYKLTDSGYVLGADLEAAGQYERTTGTGLRCDWQTDLIR